MGIEITSDNGSLFYKSEESRKISLLPGQEDKVIFKVNNLSPRLWSPEEPNLYRLQVSATQDGKEIDKRTISFGFRTVEVKGNKVCLNGKPYFMRGANHLPGGIATNDETLANRLMKLMHDGNQMVTRTHGSIFTTPWMNAADRQGVGVSYEGTWPWLMINDMPSDELLQIWKEETIALVRKYRNHPSLLMWTMNNEMYRN